MLLCMYIFKRIYRMDLQNCACHFFLLKDSQNLTTTPYRYVAEKAFPNLQGQWMTVFQGKSYHFLKIYFLGSAGLFHLTILKSAQALLICTETLGSLTGCRMLESCLGLFGAGGAIGVKGFGLMSHVRDPGGPEYLTWVVQSPVHHWQVNHQQPEGAQSNAICLFSAVQVQTKLQK